MTPVPRKPTWWRSPQRVRLRHFILQVHLWTGLVLTLYAIVIGLSGSALVFRESIEQHLESQLFHLPSAGPRVALAPVVAQVEGARPGWRVASIKDFDKPEEATTLLLRPQTGQLGNNYRIVSVDPYTGAVLADRMRFAGVMGTLTNLHLYLLAGEIGLLVSGWMALGLALLCVTGLIVWWPGVARWGSALFLRRHVRWRRFNWDVHSVTGFWVALPLLVLAFTGMYFAFPDAVAGVVQAMTFSRPAPAERPSAAPAWSQPATVDQALATARHLLPPAAPAGYLALPANPGGAYYVTGYYRGAAPYSQLVSLRFDPISAKVLSREDTRTLSRGQRLIQLFFAVHFGSFGGAGLLGIAVRWLWVLIGLSPALLAVTGVLIYLPRLLRRR